MSEPPNDQYARRILNNLEENQDLSFLDSKLRFQTEEQADIEFDQIPTTTLKSEKSEGWKAPVAGASIGALVGIGLLGPVGLLAGVLVGATVAGASMVVSDEVQKKNRSEIDRNMADLRGIKWQEGSISSVCSSCEKSFFWNATPWHHCRNCGGLFCAACTQERPLNLSFGDESLSRICLKCLKEADDSKVDDDPKADEDPQVYDESKVEQNLD